MRHGHSMTIELYADRRKPISRRLAVKVRDEIENLLNRKYGIKVKAATVKLGGKIL